MFCFVEQLRLQRNTANYSLLRHEDVTRLDGVDDSDMYQTVTVHITCLLYYRSLPIALRRVCYRMQCASLASLTRKSYNFTSSWRAFSNLETSSFNTNPTSTAPTAASSSIKTVIKLPSQVLNQSKTTSMLYRSFCFRISAHAF